MDQTRAWNRLASRPAKAGRLPRLIGQAHAAKYLNLHADIVRPADHVDARHRDGDAGG